MKFKAFSAPPVVSDTPGEFEAIVSVFNNPDFDGDIVRPGAFKKSLAAWKASGDQIPVLWSHRMDDPLYNIGSVLEAEEVEPGDPRIPDTADPFVKANGGLWVRGVIDADEDASPIAKAARRLMQKRRVTQFSYAYDVKSGFKNGDGFNELLELAVFEISPTQVGANTLTELAMAKSQPDPAPEPDPEPPAARRRPPAEYRIRCDIAAFTHG